MRNKHRQSGSAAALAIKGAKAAMAAVKMAIKLVRFAVRTMRRGITFLFSLGTPALVVLLLCLAVFAIGGPIIALGDKIVGFAGITKEDIAFLDDMDPEVKKEIQDEIGDEVIEALDCSNFAPAERQPGENCIEGLIDPKLVSPIPKDKEWLIPVWKAAAKHYEVPWQVLAAINATRSDFGNDNCTTEFGTGFYRLNQGVWDKSKVNAGSSENSPSVSNCFNAEKPAEIYSAYKQKVYKPGSKEPIAPDAAQAYDAVDSTFTAAKVLSSHGGRGQKEWKYTGSASNSCTAPDSDGPIYYLPDFGGGAGAVGISGYNKKLDLPRWIMIHSVKWRKQHPPSTSMSGAMPTNMLLKYLETVWAAFGASRSQAEQNARANLEQVMDESSGRSHAIQTVTDVNSGGNEAGGLLQFIPGTFDTWKVDGFDDRFSPLDNLLAAVNAQVNADYIGTAYSGQVDVLSGNGGWGPVGGTNPYKNGGVKGGGSKFVNSLGSKNNTKPKDYNGKEQKDKLSIAVRYNGTQTMSACYVAVVNDWYEAIVKYEKSEGISGGAIGPANFKKAIKLTKPQDMRALPSDVVAYGSANVDARIWADVVYLMRQYKMKVTAGAESGHATHGDGTAIDAISATGDWKSTAEKMATDLGWSPACGSSGLNTIVGGSCKLAPALQAVFYNGFPSHGDPEHAGSNAHIHISWRSPGYGTSSCCVNHPWVMAFPVPIDQKGNPIKGGVGGGEKPTKDKPKPQGDKPQGKAPKKGN